MLVHSWNFGSDSHLLQRFLSNSSCSEWNLLSIFCLFLRKSAGNCAIWTVYSVLFETNRQPSDSAEGLASFIWIFYRTCAGVAIFSDPIIIFRSVS